VRFFWRPATHKNMAQRRGETPVIWGGMESQRRRFFPVYCCGKAGQSVQDAAQRTLGRQRGMSDGDTDVHDLWNKEIGRIIRR